MHAPALSKVASIVPTAHLDLLSGDEYLLALTHLAVDGRYFDFYRNKSRRGAFVIFDNSTVELGIPEDPCTYLEKAIAIEASEILLPDYLEDAERTLRWGERLIPKIQASKFNGDIMAVPQGRTEEEWLECAISMLAWPITALGISKRYVNFSRLRRYLAVLTLWQACCQMNRTDVRIHLLGCAGCPEEDVAPALVFPAVRGVDSALPSAFTAARQRLELGAPRPQGVTWDFGDELDPTLLRDNLRAWRLICVRYHPGF